MYRTRRIQLCKWTGTLAAVACLSQGIARWRDFIQAPGGATYAALLTMLTLFLALMAGLALVVYAEEKARGRVARPRPLLDRWTNRFFLKDR